jgi:hypothetical protein
VPDMASVRPRPHQADRHGNADPLSAVEVSRYRVLPTKQHCGWLTWTAYAVVIGGIGRRTVVRSPR